MKKKMEGDKVRLQLDEQTEDIASKDTQLGPTTAKRTFKSIISVKDQSIIVIFFFLAEDGIRAATVTGVQTCALPISEIPVGFLAAITKGQGGAELAEMGEIGRASCRERWETWEGEVSVEKIRAQ